MVCKNYFKYNLNIFSLFFCFISIFISVPIEAFRLQYNLKPKYIYHYEIKCVLKPSFIAFDNKFENTKELQANVLVRVLSTNNDYFLIELIEGESVTRRLLRRDGTITYSTSEEITKLPFFITFPDNELVIGKSYKINKEISFDLEKIFLEWQIIPAKIHGNSILFSILGYAKFPDSRVYVREVKVKGEASYNLRFGVFESGKWQVNYSFSLNNKELAVIRNLWNYNEKWEISFLLKEVKNAY